MNDANEQIAEKFSKMGGSGVEKKKLWAVTHYQIRKFM